MRSVVALILVLTAVVFSQAQPELKNLRTAKGDTLTSPELPRLKVRFERPFKYAGGHTFILYDVARAEQHFYVDADKNGDVSRLYWVQFEGYLPSNTHAYDYDSPKKVTIDGLEFFADASASKIDPKRGRPDSDGNRARAFLAAKGYKLGSDEVMTQRLVNMVTPDNRTELMIIYLEVLTPTGHTAADLNQGGKAADQWPNISAGLLERARKGIRFVK